VDIVRAYYGAILAGHEVATLDAALRAAREHVRQAEALVKNGLATPADALLASVKAGEVETGLIEARGRVATARGGLAVALGTHRPSAQPSIERRHHDSGARRAHHDDTACA
jgi:outer membrane protein TolC